MKASIYRDVVNKHLPLCAGRELAARCAILEMRDSATFALQTAGEDAGPILWHVQNMATHYGFAPMTVEALTLLGQQLRTLSESAAQLAILERSI